METETRFNLELAIADWRDSLGAEPGVTNANLRELESHLREDIARSTSQGVAPQSAFATAIENLGSQQDIAAEHAKENSGQIWRERVFWMALAAIVLPKLMGLPMLIFSLVTNWLQSAGFHFGTGAHNALFWTTLIAGGPVLAICVLVFLMSNVHLNTDDLCMRIVKRPALLLSTLMLPVFFYLTHYVATNPPGELYSWTGLAALLPFLATVPPIVLMALIPFLHKGLRATINWIVGSRTLLAAFLIVLLIPNALGFTIFMTPERAGPTIDHLHHFAVLHTSAFTVLLLLSLCAVVLQPAVTATRPHDASHSKLSAGMNQKYWKNRVTWMCSGILLFIAWGVVSSGADALMMLTLDNWLVRLGVGIALPACAAIWIRRTLDRRNDSWALRSGTTANIQWKTLLITIGVFVVLSFGVRWVSMTGIQEFFSVPYSLAQILFSWLTSMVWPAAMVALFIWLTRESRTSGSDGLTS